MKKLELNQMENLEGGTRSWHFNSSMSCIWGLAGLGIGVAEILSGAGAVAGFATLASIGSTLPECFQYY
jgi:hypothetical protein